MPQCARYGETEEVSQLLAQGTPADAVDESGRTALFFASANGHVEVMRLLLAHGAVRSHSIKNEAHFAFNQPAVL